MLPGREMLLPGSRRGTDGLHRVGGIDVTRRPKREHATHTPSATGRQLRRRRDVGWSDGCLSVVTIDSLKIRLPIAARPRA